MSVRSVNNFVLRTAMKKTAFLRDLGHFFGKLVLPV